jgi:hypothetical protein
MHSGKASVVGSNQEDKWPLPWVLLCRLLTTVYFSLSSFLCITVIWSPLSHCMACILRRMESTVAIDLEL